MERVLIVDDENDIAELISDVLTDEGFETVIKNNGEDAVKAAIESSFDLINDKTTSDWTYKSVSFNIFFHEKAISL